MSYLFKSKWMDVSRFHFGSDPVDSYVCEAYWTDDGSELSDEEIEELNDQRPEIAQEAWHEHQIDRADALYEDMRE